MTIYRNTKFIKRNYECTYECTNVVFCEAEESPSEYFVEYDKGNLFPEGITHLYTQDNVRYYGYL